MAAISLSLVDQNLLQQAKQLLEQAGLQSPITSVEPCSAGGNNQTFRLTTATGSYALKRYFRHPGDERDRLASEYAFLRYASQAAPEFVPRVFACNQKAGLALYEYVEGTHYLPGSIGNYEITVAAQFFRDLNRLPVKSGNAANQLPVASEACFSLADHLKLIQQRIDALLAIQPTSEIDAAAISLIRTMADKWRQIARHVQKEACKAGFVAEEPLSCEQRCISPSDFGFHNALKMPDGTIRFIDFEYAGQDDPAKMTGDFFAQLAVPVPGSYFSEFVNEAFQELPERDALTVRAHLLRPVYKIKWCCIALNVFIPVNLERRKFANPQLDEKAVKQQQLEKAKTLFQSMEAVADGIH